MNKKKKYNVLGILKVVFIILIFCAVIFYFVDAGLHGQNNALTDPEKSSSITDQVKGLLEIFK